MARINHDWSAVVAPIVASSIVVVVGMNLSLTIEAYLLSYVFAGTFAGALVSAEEFGGSEGAVAASLGSILGGVLGHPSLFGPSGLTVQWGEQIIGSVTVGAVRFLVGFLALPLAAGVGFVLARKVTAYRRRGSGGDDAENEGYESSTLDLKNPDEW